MLKLPVYFISDNHFHFNVNNEEQKRRSCLFNLFKNIKSTGGTLVIGGDFFDYWFNYKYVIPYGYIDLLGELEKLNKSGIKIHYILGNHDYWDFGYFKNKFSAEVYDGNMNIKCSNNIIQVCHGDGLLKNDIGYRILKKIIRSKLFIFSFRNLHADWGCWLATKISNLSSSYNHIDDTNKQIRMEMVEYARTQWKVGINTVLLGHYHQTGIIEENGNRLIFLGDWIKHFTVTRFDENGWWQGRFDEV